MNTLMVFDYKLPLQAEGAMGTHISDVVQRTGLPQAHSERNSFIYKLAEVVGEGPVKSWENKSLQTYTPVLNVSSELAKSLVITDLNLKWSEQKKAWYSMGKIGLSNVGTKDINAVVDGFVEIRKSSEVGNIINVFLQIAPGEWYFLNFEGNRLLAYSSHDDFNTAIRNKSKAAKAKPGDYVIADSDLAETKLFVSRFRRDYFGLETPYDLNIPTPVPVTEDDPFATGTKDAKPSRQADDKDGF
jgi:hypothetical protein